MNKDRMEALAEQIANKIFESIENGTAPWLKPWSNNGIQPHNPITGTIYKGVNALNLMINGLDENRYLTFNQIKALGGYVKSGEKAHIVWFKGYKDAKKENDLQESDLESPTQQTPYYKIFSVFNLKQTSNIDINKIQQYQVKHNITPLETLKERNRFEDNPLIEEVLKNSNIPIIHHNADRACYVIDEDKIYLPPKEVFTSKEQYYSTALHELGHATGHKTRLDRDLSGSFGSYCYAKEELRAELYSFLQAIELGIDYDLKNHASYVDSWSKMFKDNKKEINEALKDAIKIVHFVKEQWYPQKLKHTLEQNITHIEVNERKPIAQKPQNKKKCWRGR
ncbi:MULTISPECIES: ArdC family protein [Helicobacter]|uniref:ArdC family protein n=1 Tax=Helicobacter TaxID=209 RepID=UPI00068F82BD|nr:MULTISPECIES: zincin-like metallopeptidase domain-containing protein [Helicobacter]